MTEIFTKPDDTGQITMSDMYKVEYARMITDAHELIGPALLCGAAVFLAWNPVAFRAQRAPTRGAKIGLDHQLGAYSRAGV